MFWFIGIFLIVGCHSMIDSEMENFLGVWRYKSHDGFDRFLVHVGVPYLASKIAVVMPAWLSFSRNATDQTYKIELATLLKTSGGVFRLDEEFDETSMGGGLMKSKISIIEGRMEQTQITDKDTIHTTRTIDGDVMVVVYKVADIISSQTYIREK